MKNRPYDKYIGFRNCIKRPCKCEVTLGAPKTVYYYEILGEFLYFHSNLNDKSKSIKHNIIAIGEENFHISNEDTDDVYVRF